MTTITAPAEQHVIEEAPKQLYIAGEWRDGSKGMLAVEDPSTGEPLCEVADASVEDARAAGETEQRRYELNAWRETPFYSERERAALEWTEALTLISQTHAPDDVFERVSAHFSEKEIVDLTYAIATINAWNRLAIAMRAVPGEYQPAERKAAAS